MVGEALGAGGYVDDAAVAKAVAEKAPLHGEIVAMGVGPQSWNFRFAECNASVGETSSPATGGQPVDSSVWLLVRPFSSDGLVGRFLSDDKGEAACDFPTELLDIEIPLCNVSQDYFMRRVAVNPLAGVAASLHEFSCRII